MECQHPTEPYDGACQCVAIYKCCQCKKPICFEHTKITLSGAHFCPSCYKEYGIPAKQIYAIVSRPTRGKSVLDGHKGVPRPHKRA
jgi:hypothetical protein